jgi:N-acetylmuramoyl-L-alanine amidase
MDDLGPLLVVLFVTALAVVAFLSLQPVPETGVVVVIDAGHGGYDTGAVVAGVQEKEINLALALLVQEKAKGTGLRVILTRDADFYVDLVERVRMAEAAGAALYVSIHANYHRNPKVCGVETWVDTNANAESVRLAEALQRAVVLASWRRSTLRCPTAKPCTFGILPFPQPWWRWATSLALRSGPSFWIRITRSALPKESSAGSLPILAGESLKLWPAGPSLAKPR